MPEIRQATHRATHRGLSAAVHRSRPFSRRGIQERLFTLAFRNLVYPQIWEDPVVDMEALRLGPTDRIVAIASGGCNVLSYLVADPAEIVAVDLNGAHIALNRLKLRGLRELPDHAAFFDFFGRADSRANIAVYQTSCARISIRRRAPIGMRAASTGAGASTRSRATSTAMACSAISSAPAMRSRGFTASDSTRCSPPRRSTSSVTCSSATSRRCSRSASCAG